MLSVCVSVHSWVLDAMPNNQTIVITEEKIMDNMDNKTDEKNFESSTKQTFANIMVDKLILELIKIE